METSVAKIRKWLKKQNGAGWAIAGLVGVVVCFEARAWLTPRRNFDDPRVLLARRPLAVGQPLHFLDFTAEARDRAAIPKDALTDQDLPLLKGAGLARPLGEGEVLTLAVLKLPMEAAPLNRTIPRGLRAFPIEPRNALDVAPGDRVDVLGADGGASLVLVEGAQVLQAQRDGAMQELVLALTQEDIELVEKARGRGKLTIALRNPSEEMPRRKPHLRRAHPKSTHQHIEIFSEGE